jgi:O-antigen ligase
MKMAEMMIEDHPLLGVGLNNFPVAMEPYVTRGFAGEFVYAVHNKYLLVWAETGIAGLIAFVWFLLDSISKGFRCWFRNHPVYGPIALGCTAALTGHMVHLLVEFFRGHPTTQSMVLIAALITVLDRLTRKQSESSARASIVEVTQG